ncbi:MAG: hypothetical protein AB7T06_08015 [Kofleriaceae bacterium]
MESLSFQNRDFAVRSEIGTNCIRARFSGNADIDAIAPLRELMGRIHAEMVRTCSREIEIDLRDLEFMNAACMKLFVNWVADILESPEEQRYRLRFVSNPEVRWQRRSLMALQCFTTDVVVLDG